MWLLLDGSRARCDEPAAPDQHRGSRRQRAGGRAGAPDMKPRYDVPYWVDRFPKHRVPRYPRHRGLLEIEVAVIGGGFTGCAIAHAFAAAGVEVALFEAGRIGHGGTARGLGLLLGEPQVEFRDLAGAYGLRAARWVWKASRRAAQDCAATLRRLKIQCDLRPEPVIHLASTPEDSNRLRREYKARREAGLEVGWLGGNVLARETAIAGREGLKAATNWSLDPYRACLGLAAAAASRGAVVREESLVRRVRPGRRFVELRTERGDVNAGTVVVATGVATGEFRPLRRHLKELETYTVLTEPLPASVRRDLGRRQAVLRDTATPPHRLRWMRDHRVLFGGADQPATPSRRRENVLIQRTGQLMYELTLLYPAISGYRPAYGWSAGFGLTADGLPYLGAHRNFPRHLFALGHGRNGLATAFLASSLLLRQYTGESTKADALFRFGR